MQLCRIFCNCWPLLRTYIWRQNLCKTYLRGIDPSNRDIVTKLKTNQWKNTKKCHRMVQINGFYKCLRIRPSRYKKIYPSISEETALNLAKSFTTFSPDELNLISQCRKSLLYKDNENWKKKTISDSFYVTMVIMMLLKSVS